MMTALLFFFGMASFAGSVSATIPAGANNDASFESVDDYRRRLGFDYGYSAKSLNPDLCKFLSEIECEEMDVDFEQQTKKVLQVGQEQENINVLVVLMRWADHEDRDLPPASYYEQLWNGVGVDEVTHPGGSIANFTDVNTHGKMKVTATVTDWKTTDNTEAYYSQGRKGVPNGSFPDVTQALASVLTQLDEDGFDLSPFDQDFDGILDTVVVLHSGYAAEVLGDDCTSGARSSNRIQSIARQALPDVWTTISFGFRLELGGFAIASGLSGVCGSDGARIGVITHEFFHLFGLVDLYDLGGTPTTSSVGGLGAFDIMASPYGPQSRSAFPGHFSPYSKTLLEVVEPIEIQHNGIYEARASELFQDIFKISTGFGDGEYLLIENRQPILFDQDLFSGGILIYHVDEQTEGIGNRLEGYPGMPGWPGNNNHFKVSVLAADRNYDLEKGVNNGDEGDFWRDGDVLGPGPGVSNAVDFSQYPNTDSYSGGNIRVTGVTISDFEETSPGVWSFRVGGLEENPSTTDDDSGGDANSPSAAPTVRPTAAPTVTPTSMPSLSSMPSSAPSWVPSSTPSFKPSGSPSDTPSFRPSISMYPSDVPSLLPSGAPSTEEASTIAPAVTQKIRMFGLLGKFEDDSSPSTRCSMKSLSTIVVSSVASLLWLFLS